MQVPVAHWCEPDPQQSELFGTHIPPSQVWHAPQSSPSPAFWQLPSTQTWQVEHAGLHVGPLPLLLTLEEELELELAPAPELDVEDAPPPPADDAAPVPEDADVLGDAPDPPCPVEPFELDAAPAPALVTDVSTP